MKNPEFWFLVAWVAQVIGWGALLLGYPQWAMGSFVCGILACVVLRVLLRD